jgi:hypothetical protein
MALKGKIRSKNQAKPARIPAIIYVKSLQPQELAFAYQRSLRNKTSSGGVPPPSGGSVQFSSLDLPHMGVQTPPDEFFSFACFFNRQKVNPAVVSSVIII